MTLQKKLNPWHAITCACRVACVQDKDGVAAAAAFAEMAADQYSQPGSPSVAQRLEALYTK